MTPRNPAARNGPPVAAEVETPAATVAKNRRENAPGGVLLVAVAIDRFLKPDYQWSGRAGEFPFPCSAASRVRRYGASDRVTPDCQGSDGFGVVVLPGAGATHEAIKVLK